MKKHELNYLLINTPLTDPTAPYHSISYLLGATAAAGYTGFQSVDANIEALNHIAQEAQVAELLEYAAAIRGALEAQTRLTRGEQLTYRYALKAVGLRPDSVAQAIAVMKDPAQFYDYSRYREAVLVLGRWIDVLSLQGFPGQFDGFALNATGIVNLNHLGDLTDDARIHRLVNPFVPYFAGPLTHLLQSRPWHFVGLSVNYTSQLPFAIFMSKLIRAVCPACVIGLGGTEISDDLKYMSDPNQIWRLFPAGDVIVAGEGESALIEILDTIAQHAPLPGGRPGILLPGAPILPNATEVRYEDLSTLAAPRYDLWNYDSYWSPEPIVLYSPTRGCYWNKCTFCDYGLNTDMPTSPSRVRPIERAVQDLRAITALSRNVYFSVDAMAPAYLKRITRAIQENNIVIRWSAELRLERSFMKGLADEFKNAGCVAISFGYESGSQRVLDLIDKGVRLPDVPGVLGELRRAGIGAQMMGFIGFPSETPEEAYSTYDFLRAHAGVWTLAGIGDFALTPGAIVAKRYRDFGVEKVGGLRGEDITRILYWVDAQGRVQFPGSARHPALDQIEAELLRFFDDRPFVGGIDSSHSILYFAQYGPDLVPPALRDLPATRAIIDTMYYETPLGGVDDFLDLADLREYHAQAWRECRANTADTMLRWLAEYPDPPRLADQAHTGVLEIYSNGFFMAQTPAMAALAQQESPAYKMALDLLLHSRGLL